jgi:arylsulfatase A-like enzyme
MSPPPLAPLTRGLGLLAGIVAFGGVGLADGFLAWSRAPRGSLPFALGLLLVLQCTAILLSFGVGLGLLEELILASARTVPWLGRAAEWALDGPRRWFAHDPERAAAVAALGIGIAATLGPIYPIAYTVMRSFHSKSLAALAIFLAPFALAAAACLLLLALSGPLVWIFRRLGRFSSPGAVLAFTLFVVVGQSVRFFSLNWAAFRNLEYGVVPLLVALLAANGLALLLLGRRVRARQAPVARRAPLGFTVAALAALALSAFTLGARQSVAAALFNRSLLAQHVARSLQVAIDLDRDGFSAVFNGGDCNDRNARISPRAHDIPDNGVDENCSGRDARVEPAESTGFLAPMGPEIALRPPSFVLLSVDAMRPDHMGCYGYRRPTTPNMDRFARGAARFTNARCTSPRSLRSFASIFTGRYASNVSWGNDVQFPPLAEDNITLAEQLRDAGYLTATFMDTGYFVHTPGFFQGFTEIHQTLEFRSDVAPTIAQLQEFLRTHANDAQPFFVWVHLMEAHDPYEDRTTPREFGHAPVDQYDEAIAHADHALGPVLEQLDAMSETRPLVTVVFADHGEAFGEHGVFHHSFDLHDEALRVPMLVRGPGITPGPRHALAALFDLLPTLLNFAGRAPAVPVAGRSLVPALLAPAAAPPRGWRNHLYAEVTPDGVFPSEQKSLYAPPYKIIYDVRRGTWELFDIARDPGEFTNLYDDRPDVAAPMRERLLTWADAAAVANRSSALIEQARLRVVPPMQHPLHVTFGDVVELLGYDLPNERLAIGDFYRATFYYRVLRRTRVPVWIDVYFEPLPGQEPIWPYFRARHMPLYGRYLTTEWNAGEIIRDDVTLYVDEAVHPVRLRSFFALSIDQTQERILPRTQGTPDGAIELAPIEIVAR